jgi:formate hydrogenlyase transcriptional activator
MGGRTEASMAGPDKAELRADPTPEGQSGLQSRLRFETFLADVGSRFLQEQAPDIPAQIDCALAGLVEVLDVDRCGLGFFSPDKRSLVVEHCAARPGIATNRGEDLAAQLPWWTEQLRQGRRMVFDLVSADLPPEAEAERLFVATEGIRSHTVLPLAVGNDVLGALGVATFTRDRSWSQEFLERLELLASEFAYAVYRYRAENRISAAEEQNREILRALPSEVFVLDPTGQVLSMNEAAWRGFAASASSALAPGSSYLAALAEVAGSDETALAPVLEGIRSVLERRLRSFTTAEALLVRPSGRHHLLHATSLERDMQTVIVHWDVSELERTKVALQESLLEIQELKDRLEAENVLLHREVRHVQGFESIVGRSAALGRVLSQIEQVAPTDSPVLLLGETGTGKDLVARALHDRSRRCERPMVAVNCAALPSTLIESELFGYERGAFTGALQRSIGRFEIADRGTIFLDEIGELPLEVQAKLLRVLQNGEFERLGSPRTIRTNARVVAASNRDLEREMREGRFRSDLYYRLSVFPLSLPPLRDRPEDIPLLVWHFVARKQAQLGRTIKRIPERLMRALTTYSWPGNIRELENVIERALILSEGNSLAADPVLFSTSREELRAPGGGTLEDVERAYVRAVLVECNWKVAGPGNAAERLGLNRSTLQFRMKKLGIERPSREPAQT